MASTDNENELLIEEGVKINVKDEPLDNHDPPELITCTPFIEEDFDPQEGTSTPQESLEVPEGSFAAQDNDFANNFKNIQNDPSNIVECGVCFKRLKESSMKQHSRTHAGLRPFKCEVCSARFTRRADVDRHHKVLHKKVRPFQCEICKKRFSTRRLLRRHVENHESSANYQCTQCNYKFGKKEYYDSHMQYLHPSPNSNSNQGTHSIDKSRPIDSKILNINSDSNVTIDSKLKKNVQKVSKSSKNIKVSQSSHEVRQSRSILPKNQASQQIPLGYEHSSLYSEEMIDRVLEESVRQSRNVLASLVQSLPPAKRPKLITSEINVEATVAGDDVPKRCKVQLITNKPVDVLSEAGTALLVGVVGDAVSGDLQTLTITT